MKKCLAPTLAAALALSAAPPLATPAAAQPAPVANHPPVPAPPALGSAYTGSAPLSLVLAGLASWATAKLAVDNVPALRTAVDDAAAAAGMSHLPGLSPQTRGWDFNLQRLASYLP